jgi:nucleoid-associated protein YgaU
LPDRLAGGAVDPTVILPDPTPTPRGNVLTPPRRVDPDEMADATPAPRVTARETPSPRTTPGVPPPPPAEGGAPQSDLAALVNPSGAPAGTGTYTIREADTLSAIAREVYGEERYWKAIVAANPGLDPNRLFVGKTIILPPKDTVLAGKSTKPAPAKSNAGRSEEQAASGGSTADARGARSRSNAEPAAERRGGGERVAGTTVREDGDKVKAGRATYRVGSGDSLISIARNVLKDENRWREIYELNKDRLKSPDVLPAGVELRMPEVKPDRGGAAKGKG